MKTQFNLYISEDKLQELRNRAKAQDIPVATYIKSQLFSELNISETGSQSTKIELPAPTLQNAKPI